MQEGDETVLSIAELMRRWRELTGDNAKAAGARLGLSDRAIEDIEQGRRRVDDQVMRIALVALIEKA